MGDAAIFYQGLMTHLATLPDHVRMRTKLLETDEQHERLARACRRLSEVVRDKLQCGIGTQHICSVCGHTSGEGNDVAHTIVIVYEDSQSLTIAAAKAKD